MAHSGVLSGKSFQSFTVNDNLIAKMVEAVKAGDVKARSTGKIQSFEAFSEGFRTHIVIGRLMIIPAKITDSPEDFPLALMYGKVVRMINPEDVADMTMHQIGETEFDEFAKKDWNRIKEELFKDDEDKYASLIVFLPAWCNPREFVSFHMVKDEAKLAEMLAHQVFSCYYNPRVSSAFEAILTDIDTQKLDVTDISTKITYPAITEGNEKEYPDLEPGDADGKNGGQTKQKRGSVTKKIILLAAETSSEVHDLLSGEEIDVITALDGALEEAMGKKAHGCGSTCEKCGEVHGGDHKCKEASKTAEDFGAKTDVVSPDSVDSDIKQPTDSVPQAAGVDGIKVTSGAGAAGGGAWTSDRDENGMPKEPVLASNDAFITDRDEKGEPKTPKTADTADNPANEKDSAPIVPKTDADISVTAGRGMHDCPECGKNVPSGSHSSKCEACEKDSKTAGGHKPGCECGFCANKGSGFGEKKEEKKEEKEASSKKANDDSFTVYFANPETSLDQNVINYLESSLGVEIGVGSGFINIYTANPTQVQTAVKWLNAKGFQVSETPEIKEASAKTAACEQCNCNKAAGSDRCPKCGHFHRNASKKAGGHNCDACGRGLSQDDYVQSGSWSYNCDCGFCYRHGGDLEKQLAQFEAAQNVANAIGEDPTEDNHVASTKFQSKRDKREARLTNLRKEAGVPLTEDAIWDAITTDFGAAPQVELPGEGSSEKGTTPTNQSGLDAALADSTPSQEKAAEPFTKEQKIDEFKIDKGDNTTPKEAPKTEEKTAAPSIGSLLRQAGFKRDEDGEYTHANPEFQFINQSSANGLLAYLNGKTYTDKNQLMAALGALIPKKQASSMQMKCPTCGGQASKANHEDAYKCKCGWEQKNAKKANTLDGQMKEFNDLSGAPGPATMLGGPTNVNENQNATAIKDAMEAVAEQEIGMPIAEKAQNIADEVKADDVAHQDMANTQVGAPSAAPVTTGAGAKITITISAKAKKAVQTNDAVDVITTPNMGQNHSPSAPIAPAMLISEDKAEESQPQTEAAEGADQLAAKTAADAHLRHDAEICVYQVLNGGFQQLWDNFEGSKGYSVKAMLDRTATFFEQVGRQDLADIFEKAAMIGGPEKQERDEYGNYDEEEGEEINQGMAAKWDPLEDAFYDMWEKSGPGYGDRIFPDEGKTSSAKFAGFNFFFPGQVLKEFYPELQHNLVDYPNDNNTGMQDPAISGGELAAPGDPTQGDLQLEEVDLPVGVLDMDDALNNVTSGYISTSPAGGIGIGRDGKPQVLDGAPLRLENDIRGPQFTEEFYQNTTSVPGKYLASRNKKAGVDDKGQLNNFLKCVVADIAATFVTAFKVAGRGVNALKGVPGKGTVQLQTVENPEGLAQMSNITASRIGSLLASVNDGDIRDCVNDATAQAAVWSKGAGGFTYEVYVRADALDKDRMTLKYSFVTGTKG